ncbi:helix-turn-helix domain-containing protein [Chryseobacterium paridis]|uniref:AraC family transcriptional regulator n=1 Tax=Chryseobacterium paridis TaxID=2800328 RepID=A0ABS1FUZ9_9FLAO|nr:helix-turn-helix domain-containing protein [Chryseobacterium paridis]MBK1896232.1 AraC family transcriptional regulator [Chryseobacterium paridis]
MQNQSIHTFYNNYIANKEIETNSFLGYFDMLLWKDFKNDLSACKTLQRKHVYKIALINGQATYHSNDQIYHVSGKNIIFINPLTRCSFSTEDLNFDARYCIFNEDFLRGTDKVSISDYPVFSGEDLFIRSLQNNEYDDLVQLYELIHIESKSTYLFKEQVIRNKLFDIIHYTQKLDPSLTIKSLHSKDLYDHFMGILEFEFTDINISNPLNDKSPSYFADRLNTSLSRLTRASKAATGKTTQDLIHERIVTEANIMLRHSAYTMKEIAWSLGFQEVSHFLNFYKRKTGNTPLSFRNK